MEWSAAGRTTRRTDDDDDGGKDNDHLRERANARERLTRRDGRYGIVHQRREERPLRDAWIMS